MNHLLNYPMKCKKRKKSSKGNETNKSTETTENHSTIDTHREVTDERSLSEYHGQSNENGKKGIKEESSTHQLSVFVDFTDDLDIVLMFNSECNNSTSSQRYLNKIRAKYSKQAFHFGVNA